MHFALLKTIAERNRIFTLSMGMSDDFETAIAFGASSVRIGSAIFGQRESLKFLLAFVGCSHMTRSMFFCGHIMLIVRVASNVHW